MARSDDQLISTIGDLAFFFLYLDVDQTFKKIYNFLISPRTTISGRGLLRRLGSGLIGLEGTKQVMISDDASESMSELGSLSLSETSDVSDEEEIDISQSSLHCAFLWERSSNKPRPRFCNGSGLERVRNI